MSKASCLVKSSTEDYKNFPFCAVLSKKCRNIEVEGYTIKCFRAIDWLLDVRNNVVYYEKQTI